MANATTRELLTTACYQTPVRRSIPNRGKNSGADAPRPRDHPGRDHARCVGHQTGQSSRARRPLRRRRIEHALDSRGPRRRAQEVGSCRTTWCWPAVGSSIRRPVSTACATWGSTATRSRRSATVSTARRPSTSAGSSSPLASSTSTATRRRCRDGGSRRATGSPPALDLEAGRAPVEIAYATRSEAGFPDQLRLLGVVGGGAHARGRRRAARRGRSGDLLPAWSAPNGNRPRPRHRWRGSSTRYRPTSPPAPSGSECSIGYTPGVDPAEYLAVAELAAAAGVPTFTHSRDIVEMAPETLIDGAEEVVRAAGTTGAHMHYCHINSTSGRHIDRVLGTGRPLPGGRRSRHDRGLSLRVGIDRDRRCVPRAGAAARAFPRHDIDHLPPHWRAHRRRCPTPRAAGDGPRRPRHRRVPRRVRSDRRRTAAALPRVPGRDRRQRRNAAAVDRHRAAGPHCLALATGSGHPPAHGGHLRARSAAVAAGRGAAHRGCPSRDACFPHGCSRAAVPAMRRKGRVQTGADADLVVFERDRGDRPGDVRRVHAPVVWHRPRDRRRDLRGA